MQAIIFDMDGVIVNSEPLHVEAEKATFKHFGFEIARDEWVNFKGKTSWDIFNLMLTKYGQDPGRTEALVDYKTGYYLKSAPERLTMIPGALAWLKKCRTLSVKMALTTSSKQILQEMTFRVFNLQTFFEVVVTGDDISQGKPHPEPYLITAERLQLVPAQCLVIEDSDHGIRSAKAAGCIPIGITTTLKREVLQAGGAARVVAGFEELDPVLQEYSTV